MIAHNLGDPRLGARRESELAPGAYRPDEITEVELRARRECRKRGE